MAHTYSIISISSVGDTLSVRAAVDGVQVDYVGSVAAAGNAMASAIAFENYIAPLLLALVPPAVAAYPTLRGLTFTQ